MQHERSMSVVRQDPIIPYRVTDTGSQVRASSFLRQMQVLSRVLQDQGLPMLPSPPDRRASLGADRHSRASDVSGGSPTSHFCIAHSNVRELLQS